MPNADAYKMVAYCITLGIRKGFLICAKDEEERSRRHVVEPHGYEIDVRAVDVEAEPETVLARVDQIADAIALSPAVLAA